MMPTRHTIAVLLASVSFVALPACRDAGGVGGARIAGGSTGSGSTGQVQLEGQEFGTIAQGDTSGVTSPRDELVTDPTAWDRLWNLHTNYGSPAPRMAWATHAVVATFAGTKPTKGYSTEVVRIERDINSGDVHATVREFALGDWHRPVAIPSQPYHMVGVPRPPAGARLHVHRQQGLDFTTIQEGSQSLIGMNDPTYKGDLFVFRTARDFASFWALHSTDPLPQVNFASEMVVAVLAGFRPSFGNSVETRRLVYDQDGDEIRIDFVVHPYAGGAAPPPATETPFQILRVARTASGQVREEIRVTLPQNDVADGAQATYTNRDVLVVRDQATYDSYVASFLGGAVPVSRPDFAKEQVIFAFLGTMSSTAWTVAVARVDLLETGELDIEVHYAAPFGRPMATPTSPFQVVRVPRTTGLFSARFVDVTPRP